MKYIILLLSLIGISCKASYSKDLPKSIYDYSFTAMDGKLIKMDAFKGKKILIVNTASKCGFTPQYEELEQLSKQYPNLVIIGFPANDFLSQEPGTNSDIQEFCKLNYGVTFLMSQKISVKGKEAHPIYQWLTHKDLNNKLDATVSWNFNKFLIDENGNLLAHFGSKVKPLSDELVKHIK